eukprot:853207_1
MSFYTFVIILITCQGAASGSRSEPFCSLPNVPFNTSTAAFEYIELLEKCAYEWWKQDSPYHGMSGYTQVYGKPGYMSNKSTIWEHDGRPTRGYMYGRAKMVVAQTFISITKAPYDIQLLAWSNYTVFYRYTMQVVMKVGNYTVSGNKTVQSFERDMWFDDGILKYSWTNSTNSTFDIVLRKIMAATEAVSVQLGFLNDDDIDYTDHYIQNPIQFIFIVVFCALTGSIAICVYLLLHCTLRGTNTRLNVVNTRSIVTHSSDDIQELHQLKN